MKFLHNIPHGKENLMYVNCLYHRPTRENDYNDALDIVYKDLATGKKYLETIENPPMYAYIVKPEYRDYNYNKEYMEIEKCDIHKVPYKNMPYFIAKQAGPEFVNQINYLRKTNYGAIKNIHKWRYCFGTDIPIEYFYRTHWKLEYDNENPKTRLTFGAADIETDAIKCDHFDKDGNIPILCATFIDESARKSYTVYLRAKDNMEQIEAFEKDIDGFVKELHDTFDEIYGVFEYNIYAYDDEREMIRDYFRFKNNSNCDVIYYWNGADFDIPFLFKRMQNLGMDIQQTVCHPDFKYKEAYYKTDHTNFMLANKRDWITTSTYYQYIDHMLLYCQTRKGTGTLRSAKLNVVAKNEIGDEKLNYKEETNIQEFPYKNFRKYLLYNIKDVLLEIGIERKTEDLQGYYLRSYTSCCPYEHTFAQTKFLTSRQYCEYINWGLVPGNNCNISYGVEREDKEEIRFSGALVGDPMLMAEGKENVNGYPVLGKPNKFIYNLCIDFDYTALYPSIDITFNISATTMIAKLFINESVEDLAKKVNRAIERAYENDDGDEDEVDEKVVDISDLEDQGMHFMDDYQTGNILNTGSKWFNLPTVEEMCDIIDKRLGINREEELVNNIDQEMYEIG